MGKCFFIADLHLGHKNILNFHGNLREGRNIKQHDEWLVRQWNSVVGPNDQVYVLGDVAFNKEAMKSCLPRMNGQKFLVRGNHDKFDTLLYLEYFDNVYGLIKKHGYWLSHAPIHEGSLRDRKNIHGHVHDKAINDDRYICVSVEQLYGVPICLDDLP